MRDWYYIEQEYTTGHPITLKELAEKYNSYAKACEDEWPKTGSVLRRIARNYIKMAEHEDEGILKRF